MLTKERMGEIAVALAKEDLKKRGHVFNSAYKGELGYTAKVTGILLSVRTLPQELQRRVL